MVKLYASITLPVNPPLASPPLTHAQCWAGFQEKARRPQPFVPIAECEITDDRGAAGLTRRVTMQATAGPLAGVATEVVTYHGNTRVGFSPC
jgi:hypothetical protein